MRDAHVMIRGFVQGVGYRKFVRKHAEELGLTGWVRNLPDGSVEALFQGDEATIGKMLEICRKGPFLSEVEDVDNVWEEQKETYDAFTIRHDF